MDFFDQPLLTPKQAAQHFGVSVGTIRNWLQNGTLHARKVGGRWRIPKHQTANKPEPMTHGETHWASATALDTLRRNYGF